MTTTTKQLRILRLWRWAFKRHQWAFHNVGAPDRLEQLDAADAIYQRASVLMRRYGMLSGK